MSTELKTVGFLVETEFLFPDEVPEGYVEGTDLVDRSEAEAEIARLREALEKAMTRMDRARDWLTDGKPTPLCNWGVLDAGDLRHEFAALNPGEQDGR